MSQTIEDLKRRCGTIVLALATATGVTALAVQPASAAAPVVTIYTAPSIFGPTGVTAGPDGALWFTNSDNNSIGRITTAGVVTNYTSSTQYVIDYPTSITTGSDGALWFTNWNSNSIGRITTAGAVSEVANGVGTGISTPGTITAGPDGALWFTNGNNSIGRITTAGVVTIFTSPDISDPGGITAGPDGALWFTNGNSSIGRITTAGVVTKFSSSKIADPGAITAGPDGALWFTDGYLGTIGRITTAGVVTTFTGAANATDITAGPDGALWYTAGQQIVGRITTAGVLSNYNAPGIDDPDGITAGPDGAMWFTNSDIGSNGNSIGRITSPGPVPTVTAVSPANGPTGGGTTITITGTGFTTGATVLIGQGDGTTRALAATVKSLTPTTITATTGGGAKVGTFNLFVTTSGGTSVASPGDEFTYVNGGVPTVTSVSPDSGPTTGGTPITVTGTGFVAGAKVLIGQGHGATGAIAATIKSVTPTTITATTGGGAKTGTFSVFVTTPEGTSAAHSADDFTYTP